MRLVLDETRKRHRRHSSCSLTHSLARCSLLSHYSTIFYSTQYTVCTSTFVPVRVHTCVRKQGRVPTDLTYVRTVPLFVLPTYVHSYLHTNTYGLRHGARGEKEKRHNSTEVVPASNDRMPKKDPVSQKDPANQS